MEAPLVARELDNEDQTLKHLLATFGSAFSLEEIASAYCKADQDADLAGEVLCGMRTRRPSADATIKSEELIDDETSSTAIDDNGYDESHHANRNGSKVSNLKRNPASAGTISSVGKNYVWRIVGSDKTLNETKPLKVEAASMASNSSVRGKNCVWRIAGSNETPNETEPLKVEAASMASNSSVNGKNCVWHIAGSNKTPNGFKMEANAFSVPVNTSEDSLLSKDSDSSTSERSSSASNASSNDDVEDFLFEMFGRGFQLERSAIREVLGHCGHDMKKSLETLLDLTAVTIDRRSNLCEGSNSLPDFKSISSAKQVQKQKSAQSNGIRTMRTGLIPSRHSSEAYEQKKEVITALIHTPEQPDLTVMSASAPAHVSDTRSRSTQTVVTEPLSDIADDYKVKTTIPQFGNMKDDAKEGSYHVLRKAVKEHRETMKEYYKAAAEAFARGDRGRAVLLLEKGQIFHNKAREADEESATKIFETSDSSMDGKMQDEMLLDLQDHDAKEAIRLVKLHLRTLSGIPLVSDLKLIIGNGDRDAEKRKRLIVKLLQKEAINWTEDEDSGAILIHLDKINPKSLSFGRK